MTDFKMQKYIHGYQPNYIDIEFGTALVNENNLLKTNNTRLYRKTLNQKRTILKLKKKIRELCKVDVESISINTHLDDIPTEMNEHDDLQWEDYDDILSTYLVDGIEPVKSIKIIKTE